MQDNALQSFIHPDMQASPQVRCSRCASTAVRAIIEVVDVDTKDIRYLRQLWLGAVFGNECAMADIVDLSGALADFLRTNDAAAPVRELIVGGAAGIMDAGDVTPTLLSTLQAAREDEGKILAVSVWDGGEEPTNIVTQFRQRAVVRGFDRFNGYGALRNFKETLAALFREGARPLAFTAGKSRGLLSVRYVGFAGHHYDTAYQTDYVPLSFNAIVVYGGS